MQPPELFKKGYCPLCATILDKSNTSREHVFPKWLLDQYKLADERLTLLNGTTIKYSQITIPVCKICNNERFGRLESKVKKIVASKRVLKKDEYFIVIWLTKIYLGIRYLEQGLLIDRSKKEKGNILPEGFFEDQSQLMYTLIRTYSKDYHFPNNRFPWSFFQYRISEREKNRYWFFDSLGTPFVAIQLGTLGIICLLTDGGGQSVILKEGYGDLKRRKFMFIHFRELTAKHLFKESLRDYIPRFMTLENEISGIHLVNLTSHFRYKKWKNEDYNNVFAHFTGVDLTTIDIPPGGTVTTIPTRNKT